MGRRRATDLKCNSKVFLPKPLSANEEAFFAVRKEKYLEVFKEYIKEKTDEGKQKSNLTKNEKSGLDKLLKRIKAGEIVTMATDKSGKLAVTSRENYIKMGEAHTSKDIEVDCEKVVKVEKIINGHVSMLQKILNIGSEHNHVERVRESLIQRSKNVAKLVLLGKDHKSVDPVTGLIKTRPVHTANTGMDAPLSDLISDFVDPFIDILENSNEIISSEDLKNKIDAYNKEVDAGRNYDEVDAKATTSTSDGQQGSGSDAEDSHKEDKDLKEDDNYNVSTIDGDAKLSPSLFPIFNRIKPKPSCKHSTRVTNFVQENGETIVASADVVSLYPSCKALTSARIVKMLILKSEMKIENINYREAARYCAMRYGKAEILANKLSRIVPKRKFKKGSKPDITGYCPMKKNVDELTEEEEIWVFPSAEPTEEEKKMLIACSIEIGVRAVFLNHLYEFDGKIYLQQDGGPIGVRLAGTVARAVMASWDASLNNIIEENKLVSWLLHRYVDDIALLLQALRKGVRWCPGCRALAHSDSWEKEDTVAGHSSSKRTMDVMQDAMNSINSDIQITVELPEESSSKTLPVLDIQCWVEKKKENDSRTERGKPTQKLLYNFYMKPMASKLCLMRRSAMPENTRHHSLANEMVRMMKNVTEMVNQDVRNRVVDSYSARLKMSGYEEDAVKTIITAGLKNYERIRRKAEKGEGFINRSGKSNLSTRYKKKIVDKSSWFMDKRKEKEEEKDEQIHWEKEKLGQNRKPSSRTMKKPPKDSPIPTLTVFFVPKTVNGELAARLRQAEEDLSKLSKNKVKIVEKAGRSIKSILVRSDLRSEDSCGREKCLACEDEKGRGRCKQRSVTYQTSCRACQAAGKQSVYIGESARSVYERGLEHQDDYRKEKDESHMMSHANESHSEEGRPKFSLKVLKSHKTPLYRQVHEAVLIAKYQPITLNSKLEYNRCLLPRLGVLMGEREMEEKGGGENKINLLEESIEENPKRKKKNVESNFRSKRRKTEQNVEPPLGLKVRNKLAPRKCPQWKRKRNEQEESPAKIPRRVSTPAETPGRSRTKYPYKIPGKCAQKAEVLTVPVKLQKSEPQNAKTLISFFEKFAEKPKNYLKIEAEKMPHIGTSKQPGAKAQAKISSYFNKPIPPSTFNRDVLTSYSGPRIKESESDPKTDTPKTAGK